MVIPERCDEHRVRNREIPGLVPTHHPGMTTQASSQKALGIDVDLELEIALGLGTGGEPLTQIFGQVEVAPRLRQETETVTALDDRKRRLRGPQHLDSLVNRRHRREAARKTFHGGTIAG